MRNICSPLTDTLTVIPLLLLPISRAGDIEKEREQESERERKIIN
jgi:hypothetical protein